MWFYLGMYQLFVCFTLVDCTISRQLKLIIKKTGNKHFILEAIVVCVNIKQ